MRISDWSSDVCSSDLVAVAVQRELRSHAEQRRERDAFDQLPGVSVDLVLQAGIARRIGRRRVVDRERAAVGHDQPLPDDLRTRLAERGFAVVAADQPRALRNEERASGRAVVDALGHLGGDQPRQVGPQPREQARRYDAAGRKQVRRGRRRERVRVGGTARIERGDDAGLARIQRVLRLPRGIHALGAIFAAIKFWIWNCCLATSASSWLVACWAWRDRKRVVWGQRVSVRVDLGGGSIIEQKKNKE